MYPLLINMTDRPVLVVGGGRIAAFKIQKLLEAGAQVRVVSPDLDESIDQDQVEWLPKCFSPEDMQDFPIIFACTDQADLNQAIYESREHWQWVNNVSDRKQSDFYNMASLEYKDMLISFSSQGQAPGASKKMKDLLLEWLSDRSEDE